MRDRGYGGFRPIHGPTLRRHGISQSATLSLPSTPSGVLFRPIVAFGAKRT